jgi:hypothetical protein
MKYTIAIETMQIIETEAENAEAAIEVVKSQMDPRVAAAARFSIVYETEFSEEDQCYKAVFDNQ